MNPGKVFSIKQMVSPLANGATVMSEEAKSPLAKMMRKSSGWVGVYDSATGRYGGIEGAILRVRCAECAVTKRGTGSGSK